MSGAHDGGPAFPHHDAGDCGTRPGMSLRDHFAGLAMAAMAGGMPLPDSRERPEIAKRAYLLADAMLEARK